MNKIDPENAPPVPPRRKRRRPLPLVPTAPTASSPVNLSRIRKSPVSAMHPHPTPSKSNNNTSVPTSRNPTSISIVATESPPCNNSKSPRDKLTPPSAPSEPPKACPLLFTFKDFENVMSASSPQTDPPILQKPLPFDVNFNENISENFPDNIDDVFFRVTTTDTPFEKFINTFSLTFDSETPDQFVFDELIDRSRSSPLKTTPKVRFIIETESPPSPKSPVIPTSQEDLEILTIVNNSESFLGVESEDWWVSGRRSPVKIDEIIEPLKKNDQIQNDEEMTSDIMESSRDKSIRSSDEAPPTCGEVMESADFIKPDELKSMPERWSPQNVDQVPHLLRNSFLDKMLSEESYPGSIDDDTTCSIIATHPKSKASDLLLPDECTGGLVEIDNTDKTDKTSEDVGNVGNGPISGKNPVVMGKSLGTIKCQVMNELLTNFHSIKLKTVDKTHDNGEYVGVNRDESLVNSACSVDKKTDDSRLVSNINCQNVGDDFSHFRGNYIRGYNRYDKCAIGSCNEVYDNDNNDMTDVGLRDERVDDVGITRGRVKSFVRNFETCANEREDYSKLRESWGDWGVGDREREGRGPSPRCKVGVTSEQMGCTVILRKQMGKDGTLSPCWRRQVSGGKKKSVKFDGGHTVIEGDGAKVKRRAPERPGGESDGGIVDVYEEVKRKQSDRRPTAHCKGTKASQVATTGPSDSTPGTSKITPPPFLKPPYVFYVRV
uniref:Uncharacterized protein n=1 Tax=Fopius arisanus TaxID=64838 RepID=A0A0C9QHJ0_9HYME